MSDFLYGIDFGTTNSALSIYGLKAEKIITTITLPSLLYFPIEHEQGDSLKHFVGQAAIDAYLSDRMSGRFMKSVKRILPRSSFTETRIHSQKANASDLVSFVLIELKARADAFIGQKCSKAIIGRPVNFDDDDPVKDQLAQERLLQAATQAGFTEIRFQFEPIGAAFTYERELKQKERVLVADLGGGTTDFTFIELNPANVGRAERKQDILATGGIYIGGDSFDSSFMWEVGTPYFGRGVLYESMPGKFLELPPSFFENICSWEKMNFFNGSKVQNELRKYFTYSKKNEKVKNFLTLIENNLGYSLFRSIETTKIELSSSDVSRFVFEESGIEIEERISINKYETIIEHDLIRMENYLNIFLDKHSIRSNEVDSLFLTGGTSLVSGVKKLFRNKFPNTPIRDGNTFISVAQGLAYSGYLFE
jgi:hypothetical chaperone protein